MDRGLFNPVAASMDAAWLTRGNGKFTKSKSGHAELIGIYSCEVLASGRRHLHCHACRTSEPGDHLCHVNWTGSSKAMESDIISDLVLNAPSFQSEKARVTVLVGDEDASTMSKVNERVPWKVIKVTDYVHGKKNFGGALFSLRHKLLTAPIIEYFRDCFSYALHQNENNIEGLKKAILNIPNHVFDQHDECGNWCGFKKDPQNYQHKRLPKIWKGSEDDRLSLKSCLQDICQRFASKSGSLAACLTSNSNESFNFLVTTLAPKNRHYGGSFSLDRRIDSAVLKKNDGVQFVVGINTSLNLSPGEHTVAYRKRVATERKREHEKSQRPEEKLKRKKLFKEAVKDQLQKEAKEGVQYESALGFRNQTDTAGPSKTNENAPLDNQESLNPVAETEQPYMPELKARKKPAPSGTNEADRIDAKLPIKIVILDTETTGLKSTDQVVQLAAFSDNETFNAYSVPSVKMNSFAKGVNKISVSRGKVYQNGREVATVSKKEMITSFIEFLSRQGEAVLLIGHNISYDFRILEAEIKHHNLFEIYSEKVAGSCESISFFKHQLPGWKSYKLEIVCKVVCPDFNFEAHNALGDVLALKECLDRTGFDESMARQFSISTCKHIEHIGELAKINTLAAALQPSGKKISRTVLQNLVENGFDFERLQRLEEKDFLKEVRCCFVRQPDKRCKELYDNISSLFR